MRAARVDPLDGAAIRVTADKDGKILFIDKAVRPATSAEDMVTKMTELGVSTVK